jgi:gliding motility-associated-like protein
MYRLVFALCLALFSYGILAAQGTPCGTISIDGPDSLSVCRGDVITLSQSNSLTNPLISWSPAADVLDPVTNSNVRVAPTASGFIRVTASLPGVCTVTDSVYVDVDRLVVPDLIPDGPVCQGVPTDLLSTPILDVGNTVYTLLGGDDVIDRGRDPNFSVTLTQDTTFTLIARSENGGCEERRTVNLTVIPGRFEITQDTVFTCLGSGPITLNVQSSVGGDNIRWSPVRFNRDAPTGTSFTVQPIGDITYFAEATINGCERIDSVAVRLDSLPEDLSMMLDPEKDPYCQGDTFFVRSPIYDAGDFPLITHDWIAAPGLQSPRDLYNGVFTGQDTAELVRTTVNGACVDTTSILVNVVEPPVVTFEPADPVVCPGDELQIRATFETGSGTLNWEDPTNTLSCTDCLDPIATVSGPTEYTIELQVDGSQCTAPLTYAIDVEPGSVPTLTDQTFLCPGESRQLIVGNFFPTDTFRITGGGVDLDDPTALVSPTETTTYTIETRGRCGTNTQTITLEVGGNQTVTANGPTEVCAGATLPLSATTDPEGLEGTFVWTLPDGSTLTGPSVSVGSPRTGSYSVQFTDARGCATVTDAIGVTVLGDQIVPIITATLPDGTEIANNGTVFGGSTVLLGVTNLDPDLNFEYQWSGNYNPETGSGPELSVTVPRDDNATTPLQYQVTVSVEGRECTFMADITLSVQQSPVEIPDFFTPNNDGRNDGFRLFFAGTLSDYSLSIFNRWGQNVFTSDDPLEAWDGTKGGTPQEADVYLYKATFSQNGVEIVEEGQFSLVR